MSKYRDGGWYNVPYSEEGGENRMRGAPVKCKAIPGSLIDKLLNNPHAALRREPQRCQLSADTKHQKRHSGEHVAVGEESLMAQRPLLYGGEGELLPRIDDMELDTHNEQKILPMGATTSSLPPSGLPPIITAFDASNLSGLEPPSLDSTGGVVTGADTPKHRIKNSAGKRQPLPIRRSNPNGRSAKGNSSYLSHQPPLRCIGEKCAHLAWLSFTLRQTSSRNGLPAGAQPKLERHGRKNRCKLW